MTIRRKPNSSWIALAATLTLLIQSLLGSYALAAGPAQRDIFGNAICADGTTGPNHPDGGHLPDCCTLSCAAVAQFPADTANSADDLIPIITTVAATVYSPRDPHPWAGERRPANPRAPPFAA